jgi:HEPN domain-containing protein
MRPPEQVKAELVRQWLWKADQDISASRELLAGTHPLLYPVCFHAQQAAEKYIKALLTWGQVEFPKTHIIRNLLGLLGPMFPDIVMYLRDADMLTPFGVDVRYPGDQPEPNLEQARQAVALAEKVRDAILPRLPQAPREEPGSE